MSKKLFNTPVIEVPKEMNFFTKNGNVKSIKTVNKSGNLTSKNKKKAIKIEPNDNINEIKIVSQGRNVESNNDKLGLDKLYKNKKPRIKKPKLDIQKKVINKDNIKLIDDVKVIPIKPVNIDLGKVANVATIKPKKTVNFNSSTQDINKVKGKKVKSLLTPEQRLRKKKRLENKKKRALFEDIDEISKAERELWWENKTPEERAKIEESDRIWRELVKDGDKKREERKKREREREREKLKNVYLR